MRVISMQGGLVWDILQRDKVYHADRKLLREDNDYSEDVKRLNGNIPIWCYYWPDLSFYSMHDGEVLDYLRMEMSLGRKNCWDNFVMFELEIPDNTLIGYTHNASEYVMIIPELRLEMVKAVYTVRDANDIDPYWKVINPIWISDTSDCDIITTTEMNCEQITEMEEGISSDFIEGEMGKCLRCCRKVSHIINGKHFCSLACMWDHESQFIQVLRRAGVSRREALRIHASYTDADFAHGIVKAARQVKEGNMRASGFD